MEKIMTKKIVLSDNALTVAKARYFNEGETWESCVRRVSKVVASVEKDKEDYQEKFFEMIHSMNFIPAGRVLRNAGKAKG
jgi:ribonucleotide reductase alpha subunit